MSIEIQTLGDILIVVLGKAYTVETIEQVMELARSKEMFTDVTNVIVDCEKLEFIDSGGGELFLLKKPATVKNLLFCGLDSKLEPVFNFLSKEWFNDEIRAFSNRDDAIKFIRETTK